MPRKKTPRRVSEAECLGEIVIEVLPLPLDADGEPDGRLKKEKWVALIHNGLYFGWGTYWGKRGLWGQWHRADAKFTGRSVPIEVGWVMVWRGRGVTIARIREQLDAKWDPMALLKAKDPLAKS